MKPRLSFVALAMVAVPLLSNAQEPVLIAGGSTPPTPVLGALASPPAYPLPVAPTIMPVGCGLPVGGCLASRPCAYPGQVVSGGYYNAPNVVYFGGPNSCYYSTYPGDCYRPGCSYSSPSVIYFGRGEACERGYAFRRFR
jgi:hypothetical protein